MADVILRPGFTPDEMRDIQREVALTYRRTMRALAAGGASPHRQEIAAVDAAIDVYQQLAPDAPKDRLEASRSVIPMISNAIRVNTRWFWEGPDA